jgi:hypothetical protein
MADCVLAIGCSHGPSIQTPPEQWARLADGDTRDPRFDYQALLASADPALKEEVSLDLQRQRYAAAHVALQKLRTIIAESKLDAMIVVSNPHRIVTAEHHPVFGIFRADSFPVAKRSERPFDPDARFLPEEKRARTTTLVEKPGRSDLANHLIEALIADDFDIACTDQIREGAALDDAFTFPLDWLLDGQTLPMVPFLLSRDLPNQAVPRRCYQLGVALRRAIEAWPSDERIGLVASGGLSHQIVDEDLDRTVVEALVTGDREALFGLSRERLNRGPGTPETLNWLTVAGAMEPTLMTLVDYIPCYRSVAGTGHGLTFGYWR